MTSVRQSVCLSWVPAARDGGWAEEGTAHASLEHQGEDALASRSTEVAVLPVTLAFGRIF